MEYPVPHEPQPVPRSMKLVLIRANGALFHSLAAAALLESDAARGADRMVRFFAHDDAFCAWVSHQWLPGKAERARMLREYVETTWPEFDFAAALQEFRLASESDRGIGPRRPGGAHEALARSLATAQAALFYRALARWTEDPGLRALALRFAHEEALSLPYFRSAYGQNTGIVRMRLVSAWFTARALVRTIRDVQLPFVFSCLEGHWQPHAPVAPMKYREFVRRMRRVMRQNGNLGVAERVLFAPWARRPQVRTDQRAGEPGPWFRPILRSA
jgi:hypothetical protein